LSFSSIISFILILVNLIFEKSTQMNKKKSRKKSIFFLPIKKLKNLKNLQLFHFSLSFFHIYSFFWIIHHNTFFTKKFIFSFRNHKKRRPNLQTNTNLKKFDLPWKTPSLVAFFPYKCDNKFYFFKISHTFVLIIFLSTFQQKNISHSEITLGMVPYKPQFQYPEFSSFTSRSSE